MLVVDAQCRYILDTTGSPVTAPENLMSHPEVDSLRKGGVNHHNPSRQVLSDKHTHTHTRSQLE